ncbi:MAG: glycosyltransferase family 2 protein [Crocinitomicaceae bacterium]|nr:glycosyltransferase family 2 protein [Crocinitomicaceae bacterium]
MQKLAVVIITKNEERNIGRAIISVKSIADEIIVVDSYSTDKTKDICAEHAVQFVQTEWKGYADTKNFANQLVHSDYIFSLDADEAPDEKLIEAILAEKKIGFSGIYIVNRLTNYCGKWIYHSGWYPDKKVRIFPKDKTKWTGAYVHEELEFSSPLTQKELAGHLNHFSYYSFKEHRERADKYSLLTAKKLAEKGKTASALKPMLSAIGRFISMYFLKAGFLDGRMGYKIALISAQSNVIKYKELRRLTRK